MKKSKGEILDDLTFADTKDGIAVKILAEFLSAKAKLEKENINNTIVMFGSARVLNKERAEEQIATTRNKLNKSNKRALEKAEAKLEISEYYASAEFLANKLAKWSKQFVEQEKYFICTGGGPGIMEACNKGAAAAGERTIGFNIVLPFEQHENIYIPKELVFDFNFFFLRKFWFSYLAKAFVVFPGGFGTMDEIFEVLTLIQTRKMKEHIPIVFFGKEFFSDLINIDKLVKYSLISEKDKQLFIITSDIDEAFNYIIKNINPMKINK